MKLVIALDYSTYLAIPAEQAGIVVPALATAGFFTKGYKKDEGFVPSESRDLTFTFEPDEKFGERPEPLVALQNSRDESEKKYLDEYSKGQNYQKRIKELEADLAKVKAALPTQPAPTARPTNDIEF
jgi:hypothetical protein